jgi:kinetochore protein Spc25, fungi type
VLTPMTPPFDTLPSGSNALPPSTILKTARYPPIASIPPSPFRPNHKQDPPPTDIPTPPTEDRRSTQTRIATLSSTLTSHAQLVARESAEKAEMHAAIHKLTTSHQERAAACGRLRTQISTTQRQIVAKRAAQAAYAEKMEAQSRLDGPELAFWEEYLGTRIEGSGREDVVRVVFVFEPGKGDGGVEREGVLELLVPERGGYEVVFSKPRLEEKRVEGCVERLNESRDIGAFLKGMRGLFGEGLR